MKEIIRGILMVFAFYSLIMFMWVLYMFAYGINVIETLLEWKSGDY